MSQKSHTSQISHDFQVFLKKFLDFLFKIKKWGAIYIVGFCEKLSETPSKNLLTKNERNSIIMKGNIKIATDVEVVAVYTANEVSKILGVSRATAYRIIDKFNSELEDKGYFTLNGKVSKKYFDERMYA